MTDLDRHFQREADWEAERNVRNLPSSIQKWRAEEVTVTTRALWCRECIDQKKVDRERSDAPGAVDGILLQVEHH